jgi:CRISPR-associated protein Cas1
VALKGDLRKTIYLTTPGTYVGVDHDAFDVRRPDLPTVRAPITAVDALVCFGNIQLSPYAMQRCTETGITVSWLSRGGRYRAGLRGPTTGNVLLRVEQYTAGTDPARALTIARPIVAAKVLNSRTVLLDAAKDRRDAADALRDVATDLEGHGDATKNAATLDELRGIEGQAAKRYFAGLATLLTNSGHRFERRERRPPTDPVNAVLSFTYTLLRVRCEAAAETVGLDPQVGFLHSLRPGRPSLALDLMEELRAPFADRLALTLLNRRQLTERSFETKPGGAVGLTDQARATVLTAWDTHLEATIRHRALDEPIERRQVPFLQALLLARHLRGDLNHYLPYRSTSR